MGIRLEVECDYCSGCEDIDPNKLGRDNDALVYVLDYLEYRLSPDGELICWTCYDENFFYCDSCGEDVSTEYVAPGCDGIEEQICVDCNAAVHENVFNSNHITTLEELEEWVSEGSTACNICEVEYIFPETLWEEFATEEGLLGDFRTKDIMAAL